MAIQVDFISIREFADRIGCSDTSVHKAIKSGKIPESCLDRSNPKRPLIQPELALVAWGKNYNPNYSKSESISTSVEVVVPKSKPKNKAPIKKKVVKQTQPLPHNIVTGEDFDKNYTPPTDPELPEDIDSELSDVPFWVKKGTDFKTAKTVEAIHRANLAQIDILKAKEILISRSQVEKEFTDIGIIIRTKVLSVPDKIIDQLRACDNRQEAHTILYQALVETLEELSEMPL